MSTNSESSFELFLNRHDEAVWAQALAELLPSIHQVDRNATSIWFAFFPLALLHALERADDPNELAKKMLLQGKFLLRDQIDTSHMFLYGHRFWPEVKRALIAHADAFQKTDARTLAERIREVARRVAQERKVEESLVTGMAAVGLMTLQQVGLEEFKSQPGVVHLDAKHLKRSPEQILRERGRDDSQGLLGFLRTADKMWTVVWNENEETARFKMVHRQEVASAAATDKRDWSQIDPRCTINEGPIPVQCRSASCGTCWVGVLGGAEKLSPVAPLERRKIREFGYIETDDPRPLIRLSCQAQGEGAISIVIPPWNGQFGKFLERKKSLGEDEREMQEISHN